MTYQKVKLMIDQLASGLRNMGFEKGDKIGIYAENSPRWIITSEACHVQCFISVALYDALGVENLIHVVNHAELKIVFGTPSTLLNLLQKVENLEYLEYIVPLYSPSEFFEFLSEEDYNQMVNDQENMEELADKRGITVISWKHLVKLGKQNPVEPTPPEPDDLAILMYTSGTTDVPKGVMMTHKNLLASVDAGYLHIGGVYSNDTYLSYLPLAHILERIIILCLLQNGVKICFFIGNKRYLQKGLSDFKPTILSGVPKIFDRIYNAITSEAESNFLKKMIFNRAYKKREESIAEGDSSYRSFFDTIAFDKAKNSLGGNLRLIACGGAPLSEETQTFLSVVFECPVLQGYGLTETCAVGCFTVPTCPTPGNVGPPMPCCEIKLVSIPDMDYFVDASPSSGEIWIRGTNVTSGYYKQPEKSLEDFDEDGWFHTGDVGQWNSNGTLSIIDRKKNIFKLAQGEYIRAEKLESIYSKSKYASQVWIYGDSTESELIAVVVVNKKNIKEIAHSNTDSLIDICKDQSVIQKVLEDLQALARKHSLAGFEVVKNITLHDEEFTPENGLATPTMKFKRKNIKQYFQEDINRMYAELKGWK